MTPDNLRSRRQLLALLASTALAAALRSAAAGPLDQGIGGTGAAPPTDRSDRGIGGTGVLAPTEGSDRGIGGTGVIGTIRKFGSIIVNDLRIAYPRNVAVFIDGRPATSEELKIGQVVRVEAVGEAGALSTRTIHVTSEVVGPVERVGAGQITVLGQTVATSELNGQAFRVGDTVAISGLRRTDGVIAASLAEARPGAVARVAGPVQRVGDGVFLIGGLRLTGLDPSLDGQRAVVVGRTEGDRLIATRAVNETALLPKVRTLSVESYVERRGDRLALGSGLSVGGGGTLDLPAGRSVRAVLTTSVGAGGRLSVDSVRANGRTYNAAPGSRGAPGMPGVDRGGPGRDRAPGPNNRTPRPVEHGPGPSRSGRDGRDAYEGGFRDRPGRGGPGGFGRFGGRRGGFGGGPRRRR